MVKVDCIRKGCKVADKVFSEIIKDFNFKTEKELAGFIKKKAKENKVKLAFPTIAAAGRNGAEIHHKPKDSGLMGFIVIDFGFKVKGYCCDITRTVFVGKITAEQRNIYNKVLRVQEASIKDLKKGISYRELDLRARKRFGKLKKNFKHALGHGVGSKIHQRPNVHPKSKDIAKIGDVITIEPGLYFGGRFGIRIEDTVLVCGRKCEVLTKSSKKLVVVRK